MRAVKLLINWAILLTTPVWIPFALLFLSVDSMVHPEQHDGFIRVISGEEWIL